MKYANMRMQDSFYLENFLASSCNFNRNVSKISQINVYYITPCIICISFFIHISLKPFKCNAFEVNF